MNRLEKLIEFRISLEKEECAPSAFPMSGPTRGDMRKLREAQLKAEAKADAEGFAKAIHKYVSDCEGINWWTGHKERNRKANALRETIRRNGSLGKAAPFVAKSRMDDVSEIEVRMHAILKDQQRWYHKLGVKWFRNKYDIKKWLIEKIQKL